MSTLLNLPVLYSMKHNAGIADKFYKKQNATVLKFSYDKKVDLQDIVKSDIKNIKFRSPFIFDAELCEDEDEFLECLQSVYYQIDDNARIVVFAANHYAGDELLSKLVSNKFTNIVAHYDNVSEKENMDLMLADLEECLSEDGLSHKKWRRFQKGYDPNTEALRELELQEKEAAKPTYGNANLKIAVIGAQSRIGTTAAAIHIAKYFADHKSTAAVFSAEKSQYADEQLEMIRDSFGGADCGQGFSAQGVDFYGNNADTEKQYNAAVYDFGRLKNGSVSELKGFDKLYLVGGISWNEFPLTYQAQADLASVNYTILVNFTDEAALNANCEIENEDGSKSTTNYKTLLHEQNLKDVLCLPFVPNAFDSESFDEIFDGEFGEFRDVAEDSIMEEVE